ncbi:hypothetical protein GCM10010401_03040 [Rarobacter faecitabidus]|uniref:DoxX-like protein n=1 Tax=Rarobacter faecitabidus TaxID=13243 RepID=A0A542ZUG6_RARFA|nr:DoxX family protein [Rarobacter faecitabidus]TQL63939.1 hypothetical protein FB461_0418 [Rarobacter faecitabidus]
MAILRGLARILIVAPVISQSVDALRHPGEHVAAARSLAARTPLRERASVIDDAKWRLAVRAHSAATIATAVGVALGRSPRAGGTLLAALTLPRVAATAPMTPGRRTPDAAFVSALGALGGALAIAADSRGKPSRAWRKAQAAATRDDE